MSKPGYNDGAEARFSMVKAVVRSRPLLLLATMLGYIVLTPLIPSDWVRTATLLAVIMGCLGIASTSRRNLVVGLCLAAPAVVLLFVDTYREDYIVESVASVFLFLLFIHIIRLMLHQIFHAKTVTVDTIGLALCTYVLLGILWVLAYLPVAGHDPNAFSMSNQPEGHDPRTHLVYFSYVTLTTLGYGDMAPVSPVAQGLAVTEALTGVLFLAVLISRLVGSYSWKRDS